MAFELQISGKALQTLLPQEVRSPSKTRDEFSIWKYSSLFVNRAYTAYYQVITSLVLWFAAVYTQSHDAYNWQVSVPFYYTLNVIFIMFNIVTWLCFVLIVTQLRKGACHALKKEVGAWLGLALVSLFRIGFGTKTTEDNLCRRKWVLNENDWTSNIFGTPSTFQRLSFQTTQKEPKWSVLLPQICHFWFQRHFLGNGSLISKGHTTMTNCLIAAAWLGHSSHWSLGLDRKRHV